MRKSKIMLQPESKRKEKQFIFFDHFFSLGRVSSDVKLISSILYSDNSQGLHKNFILSMSSDHISFEKSKKVLNAVSTHGIP